MAWSGMEHNPDVYRNIIIILNIIKNNNNSVESVFFTGPMNRE